MDEFTPDAWHDLIGNLSLAECREAVVSIARRQPFVAASEIITEVRRARGVQAAAARREALLGPARAIRDPLDDPRPLRSTIRALVAEHFKRPELTQ